MPLVDVSGTSGGAGDALVPRPLVSRYLLAAMAPEGSLGATLTFSSLFSGVAHGQGTLSDPWLIDVAGTAFGAGTLSPAAGVVARMMFGRLSGLGSMAIVGIPNPAVGMGSMSTYMDVQNLSPVCTCPNTTITLRWQQLLSAGDLPLYLTDSAGNPTAPYIINYTLFYVYPGIGGLSHRVGPENRSPVMGPSVGSFYATGFIGDAGGQPGSWQIRWRWQRSENAGVEEYTYPFRVWDAVLAHNPTDGTRRCRKHGWL